MTMASDRDDLDLRIDAALRRAFTPPARVAVTAAVPARPRIRPRVVAGALAAAALVVVAVLFALRPGRRPAADPTALPVLWVAAYRDAIARGFDTSCCDSDCDLKSRCRQMFAAAIDLADDAGIEVCGAYCGLPAGGAAAMLARAGEEPLCVFVLPRARAAAVRTGVIDGLRIHRRDVGELVVFEVSRLPDARVLPYLYVPEG